MSEDNVDLVPVEDEAPELDDEYVRVPASEFESFDEVDSETVTDGETEDGY